MKLKRKTLVIAALSLVICAALISGTMAIYTKTLSFEGLITLNKGEEPPIEEDGYLTCIRYGNSKVDINEDDSVYCKGRVDVTKKFNCGEYGYITSVNIGKNEFKNLGFYMDASYNTNTTAFKGLVLQLDGGAVMKHRSFNFNDNPTVNGNESWVDSVISLDALRNQFDIESLKNGFKLSTKLIPIENSNKWNCTFFVNDKEVILPKPQHISPLHSGTDTMVGFRIWSGEVSFSNLTVTPLDPPIQYSDPKEVMQGLIDNIYTEGLIAHTYFADRPQKGTVLNSTGFNHAPNLTKELISLGIINKDEELSWRIWAQGNNNYNIFLVQKDISSLEEGASIEDVYKYDTKTNKLEKGTAKVRLENAEKDGQKVKIKAISGSDFRATETVT